MYISSTSSHEYKGVGGRTTLFLSSRPIDYNLSSRSSIAYQDCQDCYQYFIMYTANRSTHSLQLPYIQPEYSLPLSTCPSRSIHHTPIRRPTPCHSQRPNSTSHESLQSNFDPIPNRGPGGREKSKRCIDSNRTRRSVLSFRSLRSLLLRRSRAFKSANAGLLD